MLRYVTYVMLRQVSLLDVLCYGVEQDGCFHLY